MLEKFGNLEPIVSKFTEVSWDIGSINFNTNWQVTKFFSICSLYQIL